MKTQPGGCSVRITRDTAIDGYVMIAQGDATVWYIYANHSVDPVSPLRQRKIFGDKNTIIIHLGVDVTDIQSVLDIVQVVRHAFLSNLLKVFYLQ